MKAVVLDLPDHWRVERERTPGSHRDEVWDGVLHMSPSPMFRHQDFAAALLVFLRTHWAKPTGGAVVGEFSVAPPGQADWRQNYRVPDLVVLTPDRFPLNKSSHLAGPPAVAIEIRSPGDETDEKLAFYADLGVPEVWVFDRDTRAVELRALEANGYRLLKPDAGGWVVSRVTGVRFRPAGPEAITAELNGVTETLPG